MSGSRWCYPWIDCYIENIFITGSVSQLASWSPDNAIALSPDNYPTWSGESCRLHTIGGEQLLRVLP